VYINKTPPQSSNTPAVRDLMQQYGLTLETVCTLANCTLEEAHGALHPQTFETYPLILVAKVHGFVEQELSARGWNGEKKHLWEEFDKKLKKLRSIFCKAPTR